ncbi:MAG: HD domain-containing protein [Bacteroidales bacterium]|nr:HD domain-containing protein [Bacteroidales bacterium]MBN2755880.1 HD domain-containing protein [Bacteroidales bacterium]
MKTEINKEEAYKIWDKYLKTEYLKLHTLESEAIMRKLAKHFGKDEDFWGITGLLHDLDMDIINGNYSLHGYKTVEILKEEGYEIPEMFDAIISHTEGVSDNNAKRKTDFDFILSAAENVTGIISAYVAIKPDKKIAGTKVSSVNKKLKTKAFAASVNREFIYDIEKCNITLSDFLQLSIDAMTEISDKIGM